MDKQSHRHHLVRILQGAYSGELAAAYAYRGHWKSLSSPLEREKIRQIENEEWIHRKKVGSMLSSLGAEPSGIREIMMWIIGRTLGVCCHIAGWFLPMYFAGRLETANVEQYEDAAFHAAELGLTQMRIELLSMAEVEKEHEVFFLGIIANHRLLPLMRLVFK